MGPTALLVCADAESVQVLSRILGDLEIEVEPCGDFPMARARIDDRHFDAILIDCLNEPAAVELIAHTRSSPSNHAIVVIALLDGQSGVREIFAAGANFVLYKPISRERAAHSIRAARSLIRRERRVLPRIAVEAEASMAYPGKEDSPAKLVDLNEHGLKIQTADRLPPSCKVYFQFTLPGEKSTVRLSGEVMWQDSAGRVGIRFANVPPSSRRVLQAWVQHNLSTKAEVSSSHAPVSQTDDALSGLSAGLGLLSGSTANRRDPTRQACSLGADVYRPESSAPMRCTLSDIGTGGCYVETTDPFPEGTAVEIVVRTENVKLCITGRVRSLNRGFGMGVQFSLRNADQQRQVQQLVNCAEAEAKVGK
jgi:CheY-like chemotaxis protein